MNFTREPVIETIITPKEGYKLLVRSSKATGQEEYQVDSVEVVSFGHSFFFRSLEKPRSFLVPISDYEIVETKEMRVALKNAPLERAIKIGGGREAPMRPAREAPSEKADEGTPGDETAQPQQQPRGDRRRDRRRHRGRRRGDQRPEMGDRDRETISTESSPPVEGGDASDETQVSSSTFTTLFPPPPTLISETIGRYKEKDFGLSQGGLLPKPVEEEKKKKEGEEENYPDSEGNQLSRVATTSSSMSFTQSTFTSFTPPFSS